METKPPHLKLVKPEKEHKPPEVLGDPSHPKMVVCFEVETPSGAIRLDARSVHGETAEQCAKIAATALGLTYSNHKASVWGHGIDINIEPHKHK